MKYLPLLLVTVMLACHPAHADEKVGAAIRALDAIEADAGRMQAYCAIVKEMFAAGENEEKNEELEARMEQYLTSLGPEYLSAWELGEDLEQASADAARLEAAFERLEDKCIE